MTALDTWGRTFPSGGGLAVGRLVMLVYFRTIGVYVLKCLFQSMNGIIEALKKQRGSRYAAQKPDLFSMFVVASVDKHATLIILRCVLLPIVNLRI